MYSQTVGVKVLKRFHDIVGVQSEIAQRVEYFDFCSKRQKPEIDIRVEGILKIVLLHEYQHILIVTILNLNVYRKLPTLTTDLAFLPKQSTQKHLIVRCRYAIIAKTARQQSGDELLQQRVTIVLGSVRQ